MFGENVEGLETRKMTFMTKYAASKPLQDYTSEDFKEQFRVAKREASAQWRGAAPRAGNVGLNWGWMGCGILSSTRGPFTTYKLHMQLICWINLNMCIVKCWWLNDSLPFFSWLWRKSYMENLLKVVNVSRLILLVIYIYNLYRKYMCRKIWFQNQKTRKTRYPPKPEKTRT